MLTTLTTSGKSFFSVSVLVRKGGSQPQVHHEEGAGLSKSRLPSTCTVHHRRFVDEAELLPIAPHTESSYLWLSDPPETPNGITD